MNMVIVIEIVAGIFVLAGAVMFAVRDTRQRRSFSVEQELGPEDVLKVQASSNEREVQASNSEREVQTSSSERDAEKRGQSLDPSVGVDA